MNTSGGESSGILPIDIASLDQTRVNFGDGRVNATKRLKANEVGRVSNAVFIVRNLDGTTAQTTHVKVPSAAGQVSTRPSRLASGQCVVTFVE